MDLGSLYMGSGVNRADALCQMELEKERRREKSEQQGVSSTSSCSSWGEDRVSFSAAALKAAQEAAQKEENSSGNSSGNPAGAGKDPWQEQQAARAGLSNTSGLAPRTVSSGQASSGESFEAMLRGASSVDSSEEPSAADDFAAYMTGKRSRAQSGDPESQIKSLQARLKSLQSQLQQVVPKAAVKRANKCKLNPYATRSNR